MLFRKPVWPFEEPQNAAVLCLRRILQGTAPILLAVYDNERQWQFLDGDDVTEAEAVVVGLGAVFAKDASIGVLADLPAGWFAWRKSVHHPWQRAPDSG